MLGVRGRRFVVAALLAALVAAPAGQAAATKVQPLQRICFEVAGEPGDIAVVNLTPVQANAPGHGQLVSSTVTDPPNASNVNYAPGSFDPNVALAPIGPDHQVCYLNSNHTTTHLIADHLGTIHANAFIPTPTGTPERKLDTRIGLGGDAVAPSGQLCFAVAGQPGDVAIVNLTPVQASAPGNGQLVSSDIEQPSNISNVNFARGTTDPNVAFAPVGVDGQVCYVNSNHATVHLIADQLGTIRADAYTVATPTGTPERKLDTRIGLGGNAVPPSGRACFEVVGEPGDIAVVNLTPVQANAPGHGQLVSSTVTDPPNASNVNYAPGTFDPNVALAPIGPDHQVCYLNSNHTTTHLIADHLGTIHANAFIPTPTGTPERKLDTRPPPPVAIEIGRSVQGRPITVIRSGTPGGIPVLAIGTIHGDEQGGLRVIQAMQQLEVPDGIELWTVPTLNPDGVEMDVRGNARGVDLNRNFATANWASVSAGTDRYSGPSAASEPETQVAQAFIDQIRPRFVVVWHQVGNHVDDNHSVARYDLLETFAMFVGMPRLSTPCGGAFCVGTATQYINAKGNTTAFTVELPSSVSSQLAGRQADGFLRTAALLAG